jgi:catechol 1,2-dioxygenase
MTTETDRRTEFDAVAAESGANATRYFQEKAKGGGGATDAARVHAVATAALSALHDVIAEHKVTYEEYDALKAWLIRVGQDGEWPLFLDVFLEHAVEASVNAERQGSKGTVEGPFYVPGAPALGTDGTMPMRDDEPGTRLDVGGIVTDLDGKPLAGATIELWHCDDNGFYSQFAPGLPEWNLRGTLTTGADGRYLAHTIQPAPYQIPHDGATGSFIETAGLHAWRPAHLHLKVSAPKHRLITTQLYFEGDDYLDTDVAAAVKPELVLSPVAKADGSGKHLSYDFVLEHA